MKYQKIHIVALMGVFCLCAADGDGGVGVGGKVGRLAQRACQRYGVKRFEEQDIELPEELPGWFSVEVEYEGVAETLELERCSVRGPNFKVLAQGADGKFTQIDPGPERTYRGRLKGHSGSVVAATLAKDGLRATICTEFGSGWEIRPMRRIDGNAARRRHIVFCEEDVEVEEAAEPGPRPSEVDGMPVAYYDGDVWTMDTTATAIGAMGVTMLTPHGSDVMRAEAGIDVEYDYFAKWSTVGRDPYAPINNNIATTINEMNIIFVRDCMIEYVLGRVVIRTSVEACPYHDINDDFSKLGPFRTEWRNNQSDSTHDLAALVYDGGGGMAWVGVVCSSYAYSINGDSGDGTFHHVWRHETGHNWGCADYHKGCPEGRTILCGNSMAISRFSIEEVKTILAHRDSRSCLVNIGPYTSSVPPYAGLDVATVNLGDGPIWINVLENDHDANGDAISVVSYDETSMLGGSVLYSIGGRGRPPALVYTSPKDKHGHDRFTYTIADETGNYAIGTVAVEIRDPGPTGHWKLDEISGIMATDSVGSNDGVLINMGDADWVSGQFGGALEFDVVNDYLYMEDFSMSRDAFTAALWFKPAQDMDSSDSRRDLFYWHRGSHPHLTFNRGGEGKIGLYVEVDDVEYNDVTSGTTTWSAARWYHIATTFDGNDFVLYVDGIEENRVSHPGVHVANEGLSIGSDEGARGFGCRIDDVRFYNYAL
ncbi:MAG: LamG-like jellyroll fold domain-containing protein, partial [Planctomycetota bacterium]